MRRRALLLAICAGLAPGAPAAAPRDCEPAELLLALTLNGTDEGVVAVLRDPCRGEVLLAASDLARWRVRDTTHAVKRGDIDYVPLSAIAGVRWRYDEPAQRIEATLPASAFTETRLDARPATPPAPVVSAATGGFANYDVSVGQVDGERDAAAALEVGAFGRAGVAVTSFVAQHSSQSSKLVRLDTTFVHDSPDERTSWRVGDAISRAPGWGGSVRFGGVQYATDFALDPTLVTFPLPGVRGEASVPSVVDVFLDDALRVRRDVPAGPFRLDALPSVSGEGEARIVVTDALGRQQTIVQPFYASARLLQPGLRDFSFEAGFVREDYGLASNEYGRAFAAGTWRQGLTDRLTIEAHGEASADAQSAGASLAVLFPRVGLFSASLAGSNSHAGTGALAAVGYERQTRRFNVGAALEWASAVFTQLGRPQGDAAPVRRARAYVGLPTDRAGSFSLSLAAEQRADGSESGVLGASWSRPIGQYGFLGVSLLRLLGDENDTFLSATYTRPLGPRTSASVGVASNDGSLDPSLSVVRNRAVGTGYSYRVDAAGGESSRVHASGEWQGERGAVWADVDRSHGVSATRVGASGGVAVLGGDARASRRIDGAFAVVEVPGYANVRVYQDNQLVARTDARGRALLPRLRPFERNAIRIEQADLPLDARVDALALDAVPPARAGALVPFPVRRARHALIDVVLEDGTPLPAGAQATVGGATFAVGLRGEVYLTDLGAMNAVDIAWRDQHCRIDVPYPETSDSLPNLGTFTCRGVAR